MQVDLFEQVVDTLSLDRNFRTIRENEVAFKGAMRLVNEVYNPAQSIDDDFKIQFQTNGFDARIWELYLLAAFQELGFDILRKHKSRDFELLLPDRRKIFVEAVTSNPAFNQEIEDKLQIVAKLTDDAIPSYLESLRKTSLIRIAGRYIISIGKNIGSLTGLKGNLLFLLSRHFIIVFHWILLTARL